MIVDDMWRIVRLSYYEKGRQDALNGNNFESGAGLYIFPSDDWYAYTAGYEAGQAELDALVQVVVAEELPAVGRNMGEAEQAVQNYHLHNR